MKAIVKPLGILFALVLLLSGCGSSSNTGIPAEQAPGSLEVGGEGITLTETVDDLGEMVPVNFSNAVAINNSNQVIGFAEITPGADFVAALWTVNTSGGVTLTPQELAPIEGNSFSAAFAIDESGNVVGQSADGDKLVAVLWAAGSSTPTSLPALTASGNSKAFGISADGTLVVGEAQDATLRTRGVIWVADAQGDFTSPPAVLPFAAFAVAGEISRYSSANGVARSGATEILVVGEAEAGDRTMRGALWRSINSGATFTASSLGTDYIAHAVNGNGLIVGEFDTDAVPVMWTVTEGIASAPVLLAGTGSAVAINENGRIAGWMGIDPNAAVWTDQTPDAVFDTSSQAFGLNSHTAPLVVGRKGSQGFIKRVQ
jgi:hypothetical protein